MNVRRAGWQRIAAWATWATQVIIIGTGGAVRLTGSGLGCSDWPHCTPGDFFPVPETGIHGLIEFGNRAFSVIVLAACVLLLVLLWKDRATKRVAFRLSLAVVVLTVAQALIGAVVVWLHLEPFTVGVHFFLSLVLVILSAWLLYRVVAGPAQTGSYPALRRTVAIITAIALGVVVVLGVLTTGSGPHAGDGGALRNGLNSELLQHLHAIPSYVMFAAVVCGLVLALKERQSRHATWYGVVLGLLVVQIAVGLIQANTGLPVLLVGIHMLLSSLTVSAVIVVLLTGRDTAESRVAAPA